MSLQDENKLLKMMNEMQASRIEEQEKTIRDLRMVIDELRSVKANLEETLEEFRRQFFGVKSEKTSAHKKTDELEQKNTKKVPVKAHTRERKPKATREDLYANLPVREVLCELPEEERTCDWCNSKMVFLNKTFVREELRITPAKIERI